MHKDLKAMLIACTKEQVLESMARENHVKFTYNGERYSIGCPNHANILFDFNGVDVLCSKHSNNCVKCWEDAVCDLMFGGEQFE